jgi:hypothetical protein
MLDKGKYYVKIVIDGVDLSYYNSVYAEMEIDDFLDVHHRGKLAETMDDLRDKLIRETFKDDLERTE